MEVIICGVLGRWTELGLLFARLGLGFETAKSFLLF
jgi:hypothetical protein